MLVTLLLAELFLRATENGRPWKRQAREVGVLIQRPPTMYDPAIGVRFRPGWAGRFYYAMDERFSYLRANATGFRFPDYAQRKTPGTFRVALIGDSAIAALQVDPDVHFRALLEGALNAGGQAEVLNFAIPGSGPVSHLNIYRRYARPFHPDVVVQQITTANDFTDNIGIPWRLPNGELNPKPFVHAPGNLGKYLKTNSSLVMALWSITLKRAYRKDQERNTAELDRDVVAAGGAALERRAPWELAEVSREHYEDTLAMWDALIRSIQEAGATCVIVLIPYNSRWTPQGRWTHPPEKIVLHERLAAHFREKGAIVIMGSELLDRHTARYGSIPFTKWKGYLSEAGHKSLADLLQEKLRPLRKARGTGS